MWYVAKSKMRSEFLKWEQWKITFSNLSEICECTQKMTSQHKEVTNILSLKVTKGEVYINVLSEYFQLLLYREASKNKLMHHFICFISDKLSLRYCGSSQLCLHVCSNELFTDTTSFRKREQVFLKFEVTEKQLLKSKVAQLPIRTEKYKSLQHSHTDTNCSSLSDSSVYLLNRAELLV